MYKYLLEQNKQLQEQVQQLTADLKTQMISKGRKEWEIRKWQQKYKQLQQQYTQVVEAANKHCEHYKQLVEEWAALTQQHSAEQLTQQHDDTQQ